jgi:diadenosine tetraphosphate (Ap4A) HIT family hydrolase
MGRSCSDDCRPQPVPAAEAAHGRGDDDVWRKYFTVPAEKMVFEDDRVVAFHDRTPRAELHILVVPRHDSLRGVESLRAEHLPLLAHMEAVAQRLSGGEVDDLVLGFHRKPLRSVNQLHLHVMRPPFRDWHKIRYTMPWHSFPFGYIDLSEVVRRVGRISKR